MAKHAGSRWLNLNWDTLPKNHWVAANDNGMVTESPDYTRVVDELTRRNMPFGEVAIAFIPEGIVQ